MSDAEDAGTATATSLRWRDRSEGQPRLAKVQGGMNNITLPSDWAPAAVGDAFEIMLAKPEFLIGVRVATAGHGGAFAVDYCHQGGAGEASVHTEAWCNVVESAEVESTNAEVLWPDVGAHSRWRLRCTRAGGGTVVVESLLVTEWGVRLDELSPFPTSVGAEHLSEAHRDLLPMVQRGELVLGETHLLSQLYHESDLLGWGAPIHFPCFMTIWAKPASTRDFAGLVHRFSRRPGSRAPLLVLSGTDVDARQSLRRRLKSLLRPEYAHIVADIPESEPDRVVDALWQSEHAAGGGGSQQPAPTLAQVNERLAAAQDRLGVTPRREYAPQFARRDPLILLLTREAFGGWAPNRVAAEVEGHDIFRTYAKFSRVDGVVAAEDAVWLHEPMRFFAPAPDVQRGDKRPRELLRLIEEQRPAIGQLLSEYEANGWIDADFRRGLEEGLLKAR